MSNRSIKKRNKRSRGRGKRFEYAVEKRLRKRGYPAERIFYSGAGLPKPYDVEVTWDAKNEDILMIEAKRTWNDFITLQSDWIEEIGPRHVVVFAMGDARKMPKRQGTREGIMYSIEEWHGDPSKIVLDKIKVGKKIKEVLIARGQSLVHSSRSHVAGTPIVHAYDAFVYKIEKSKRIYQDKLLAYTVLVHNDKYYLIRDFDEYMEDTWSHKLPGGDSRNDTNAKP